MAKQQLGRAWLVCTSASIIIWSACGGEHAKDGLQDVSARTARLSKFHSCEELETYIKASSESDIRIQMSELRSNFNNYYYGFAQPLNAAEAAPTAGAADSSTKSSAAPAHSTTNTQVQGVDEADIIKTDGNYIYVVQDSKLIIFSVAQADLDAPAQMTKVAEVALIHPSQVPNKPGSTDPVDLRGYVQGIELFIHGDKAVVFANVYGDAVPVPLRVDPTDSNKLAAGAPAADIACVQGGPCGGGYYYGWGAVTQASVFDLTERAAPKVVHTWAVQGDYVTSRMIGGVVHIVTNGHQRGPVLKYYPEYYGNSKTDFINAVNKTESDNVLAIRSSKLDDWLPQSVESIFGDTTDTSTGRVASCDAMYRSLSRDGLNVLTVATLNLDKTSDKLQQTGILSHGAVVYASQNSLYVATHPWNTGENWWGWWQADVWRSEKTRIHKFDIATDPTQAQYVATGVVPGAVINQFALDESNGHLRVATTVQAFGRFATISGGVAIDNVASSPTPSGSSGGTMDAVPKSARFAVDATCNNQSSNNLFILGQTTDGDFTYLDKTGEITNLACGETIQSARFVGDTGYVVTYRQIDPLFVFDLKDPTAPKKLAELKIEGFSSYMHPIDDNHLLTIGYSGTAAGASPGVKLTLFDVTDKSNPKVAKEHVIAGGWSNSEALFNHKAFSYFPADAALGRPKPVLAIPLEQYNYDNWSQSTVGLRVFSVDVSEGFSELANISHDATSCYPKNDVNSDYYVYRWQPQVRRSLYIQNHLYSLSELALVASPFGNLTVPSDVECLPSPAWFAYAKGI